MPTSVVGAAGHKVNHGLLQVLPDGDCFVCKFEDIRLRSSRSGQLELRGWLQLQLQLQGDVWSLFVPLVKPWLT